MVQIIIIIVVAFLAISLISAIISVLLAVIGYIIPIAVFALGVFLLIKLLQFVVQFIAGIISSHSLAISAFFSRIISLIPWVICAIIVVVLFIVLIRQIAKLTTHGFQIKLSKGEVFVPGRKVCALELRMLRIKAATCDEFSDCVMDYYNQTLNQRDAYRISEMILEQMAKTGKVTKQYLEDLNCYLYFTDKIKKRSLTI